MRIRSMLAVGVIIGSIVASIGAGCGSSTDTQVFGSSGGVGGATSASVVGSTSPSASTGGTSTTSASNGGASVTASSSGTGGASATASSTGMGGASSSSTVSASSGSGGGCPACGPLLECCNGECINPKNDIKNCGGCNVPCGGQAPFCDNGVCGNPPCNGQPCAFGLTCCGAMCCAADELCCELYGPQNMLGCAMKVNGTCPVGCPGCVCASPDTPIATPLGERAIEDLAVGDLIYSVKGSAFVAAPILQINRVPVHDHHVVRVTLDSGRVLEISGRHPTADGRTFADLTPGSRLDEARVVAVEIIPYMHRFTYDILPATESGDYVAGGVVIGSTLKK